jgi:hypothetical protein
MTGVSSGEDERVAEDDDDFSIFIYTSNRISSYNHTDGSKLIAQLVSYLGRGTGLLDGGGGTAPTLVTVCQVSSWIGLNSLVGRLGNEGF